MINLGLLHSICRTPQGRDRAALFVDPLNLHMPAYGIDTPVRAAAFLGQILHESGEFRYLRELGNDEYLKKYDTGRLAARLGNTPEDDGDGQLYRGRGLIQVTGRANYERCGQALGLDLIAHPEMLESPNLAVQSACWFWDSRDLNQVADDYDYRAITKAINGGYSHMESRITYWERARRAFRLM